MSCSMLSAHDQYLHSQYDDHQLLNHGSYIHDKGTMTRVFDGLLLPAIYEDPLDDPSLLIGSDPIKAEIDRLENEIRAKNRELVATQAEVKALKLNERSREKALQEMSEEVARVHERLERTEILVENKNLEIKRLQEEKKAAVAAQCATEATLRRINNSEVMLMMKEGYYSDMPPIEAILAPIESDLKLARQEISRLQDDNKALDRLMKLKESALLDAEKKVELSATKASMVDDLQNRNQELIKQIEVSQETNKLLDKLHRQKITEIEKLSNSLVELEEQVLSSASHADNITRDFQRQLQQLEEEKKTLERELARVKVTANRVAIVAANGWKDAGDHQVMPVRKWLEERRFLQNEMQQLRDKLALMERTAKSEAQIKEKFQLRLKVLEESLMHTKVSSHKMISRSTTISTTTSIVDHPSFTKQYLSRHKASTGGRGSFDVDSSQKDLLNKVDVRSMSKSLNHHPKYVHTSYNCGEILDNDHHNQDQLLGCNNHNDYVSVHLYDVLQKEVISLRKACQEKDRALQDKENAIEMLEKKVTGLQRTMEVEGKRMRREVAAMEKELVLKCHLNDHSKNSNNKPTPIATR